MDILEENLKDYIWEHFAIFQDVFSKKVYKNLLQFRTKRDKSTFNNILDTFIELDNDIIDKIKKIYKPIDKMIEDEIITLLKDISYEEYREKEKYINRALELNKSNKNISIIFLLSLYYNSISQYDKALELSEEVTRNYSTKDKKGMYDKDETLYKKTLKINEDILGINHPDTATSYTLLAGLYNSKGEYKKAEPLYLKALKIREEVLGINHPDTASSYNNLASLYNSKGEYKKAEFLWKKAFKISEEVLGRNHHNTKFINSNLKSLFNINTTYLEAIKIKNYFSIKDMEIDNLKNKKEIYFVGENGDGKTVLLQAIALALKGDKYSIFAEDYIKDIKDKIELSTKDMIFSDEYKSYKNIKNLFAYGISRNKYDSENSEVDGYSSIFETPLISIKLRKPQDLLRKNTPLIDDEFIPKIQELMSDKFKIIKKENEIYFQESHSETIPFKMLSEGYKSTIIWLCDLLSRMMENQPKITELKDFQAIVLIDEVDLYLHPKWKYDFMNKLRKIFPNIQFIMTTHSLVTVLGASEDAVFYKVYKEGGDTKITGQIDDISYYTSNILLTSPIFSLDSMKARGFKKDERLSSDDYIYREIHTAIREHMKNNPSALDDELKEKVRAELKERLAKLRKK